MPKPTQQRRLRPHVHIQISDNRISRRQSRACRGTRASRRTSGARVLQSRGARTRCHTSLPNSSTTLSSATAASSRTQQRGGRRHPASASGRRARDRPAAHTPCASRRAGHRPAHRHQRCVYCDREVCQTVVTSRRKFLENQQVRREPLAGCAESESRERFRKRVITDQAVDRHRGTGGNTLRACGRNAFGDTSLEPVESAIELVLQHAVTIDRHEQALEPCTRKRIDMAREKPAVRYEACIPCRPGWPTQRARRCPDARAARRPET